MDVSLPEILERVEELALHAGQMVRDELYRPGGPRGGGDKADVDVEIERYLRQELMRLVPGSAVLGEELGQTGSAQDEYWWLVDPHDGTAAFLRGFRGSTVSIGLLRHHKPVLGVVYAPLYPNDTGDLISGGDGLGLRRNGRPWKTPLPDGPLRPGDIVVISQDADLRPEANLRDLQPARYLAMASIAYRLALVAVGDGRAAKSLVYLSAHDVAAAHALLLAAGKHLVPFEGRPGAEVTYAPGFSPMLLVGGDRAAVDQLRISPRVPVLSSPKVKALSGLPRTRRWRQQGLSLERAQGCLMGQLAADSLGSLVEFKAATLIAEMYPQGGPFELLDGGVWNTLAGQPTDDSEMALALARQIIEDGGYHAEKVRGAYQSWLASGPFDIGTTTRRGLEGEPDHRSRSNGSLMRCSPLGIAFETPDLAELAPVDSALTHPNSLVGECCRLYTQTISRGIAGMSPANAVQAALESSQGEVREWLSQALKENFESQDHPLEGVRVAFANAFSWLGQESPLEEAVIQTVRQGGDTDTNAAIAGALLGAFQGLAAVPRQWRLAVLTCRPHRGNSQSQQPRPRTYWPVDALNLAELLLEVRCRAH